MQFDRRELLQASSLLIGSAMLPAPLGARQLRSRSLPPFYEEIEHRTFQWFWDHVNRSNGLVPDRWPSPSFSSIAAVGFALPAYAIGVERGWCTREDARELTLTTLRFFWNAPQGPQTTGVTGYKGFFYHFLDMKTGERFGDSELSTVDTSIFLAGALFCQSF
ncbi:MAG TPA: Tat pathway signal protein, partial [Sphingomicrobium sp.]|nr:Tat pathway signal protein [Sphingomicrobium sp.]